MYNNTLCLPLQKKWYNMIKDGRKNEEYRDIKAYWIKRMLLRNFRGFTHQLSDEVAQFYADNPEILRLEFSKGFFVPSFNKVKFSMGYTKETMTFSVAGLDIGKGTSAMGASDKEQFIIHLVTED